MVILAIWVLGMILTYVPANIIYLKYSAWKSATKEEWLEYVHFVLFLSCWLWPIFWTIVGWFTLLRVNKAVQKAVKYVLDYVPSKLYDKVHGTKDIDGSQ